MPENTQDRSGRVKLLLVDDEAGYVQVLAKRMARRNIEVTPALSGSEAIRVLRDGSFDVAVLDLKMEDMDGIEVLKIFKMMDPTMPVIMLTGHGSETAARQGIEFGAYDYLTKPCDLMELIHKIREACGKKG
ncbi:MAG TPA: response regulator [Syntrophobacteraceae bacterium]|nr:response regulator [Syntrophobacteraceae bacterium]